MSGRYLDRPGMDYLGDAIDRAVQYCADEFDMSYAEAVGLLFIKSHMLARDCCENDDEDDDDDNDSSTTM